MKKLIKNDMIEWVDDKGGHLDAPDYPRPDIKPGAQKPIDLLEKKVMQREGA